MENGSWVTADHVAWIISSCWLCDLSILRYFPQIVPRSADKDQKLEQAREGSVQGLREEPTLLRP